MDIDYTVAALMFPAIPLMMTMYSNRFHTLSALIRQLHDKFTFEKKVPPELEKQLHVLNKRTNYLKFVMEWVELGASIVGGCCAVGPEHIELIANKLKNTGYQIV